MARFDGNLFRGIGFDRPLLNRFAHYFLHHVHGQELNLVWDLFDSPNSNQPAIFY